MQKADSVSATDPQHRSPRDTVPCKQAVRAGFRPSIRNSDA